VGESGSRNEQQPPPSRPEHTRLIPAAQPAFLQEGWVIANHILVSFHVAFISSVLALPSTSIFKGEVLRFIFFSPETIVSALFMYVSFHTCIALHEMGHFLTAAKLNALNESILEDVQQRMRKSGFSRFSYYVQLFIRIPYGAAPGVRRQGLNYYPDAPYNLAVAAAGPRASRNVAAFTLPLAAVLVAVGVVLDSAVAIYVGRPLLGIGLVSILDFLLADPGKYAEFRDRERKAREKARSVAGAAGWLSVAAETQTKMLRGRMQEATHPHLGPVTAPWQFRNCGMGGRHTEKEYPESNVSMQEAMFIPLDTSDYQEAQELTVRLQTRLKELIEKQEGCRVMGIGLEGGLAPYIEKGSYPLPEVRLWAMMKQTIEECGCRPGKDVAIALDPAMSELEIAYRDEFNVPDAVGMYLFWRDKTKTVMDRDGVMEIYRKAIEDYEIPILSIEDGFSENDDAGWKLLLDQLGDRIFVIGDDLVTTKDSTIERDASKGLINTALIKANQIGTLYETLIAMLTALGKNLELVVSHRSKSPNDDMEAQIALACNALGLKAGGGANTERLVKYQAVTEQMLRVIEADTAHALREGEQAQIRRFRAYEEATNAGIPTVGVSVELVLPESGISINFKGATPLGTSAGTGEAVHLVDSFIEYSEHHETIDRFSDLFRQVEPGVRALKKDVSDARIRSAADNDLTDLFARAQRYEGKGCLNAVDNVLQIIAPHFEERDAAKLTLKDLDKELLQLELQTAKNRGKLGEVIDQEQRINVMQRKQNLGMNAILSVSLALARTIAHVQGKQLYELLREEMLEIIEHLAAQYDVPVQGTSFFDYVMTLRQVNQALEEKGTPLHVALREITGIYAEAQAPGVTLPPMVPAPAAPPESTDTREPHTTDGDGQGAGQEIAKEDAVLVSPDAPSRASAVVDGEALLTASESAAIKTLNRTLHRVYVNPEGSTETSAALDCYAETKTSVSRRTGHFSIANNRIFRSNGDLLVPYLVGDSLLLYAVRDGVTDPILTCRFPPGTIYSDRFIQKLAEFKGDVIDLEKEIWVFDTERVRKPQIARVRDLASLVRLMRTSSNRHESVYYLRTLVAWLCNVQVGMFVKSKNLVPETAELTAELVPYLNKPVPRRLLFLTRILIRNLSSLVGKPNVIDRMWNNTIKLAEIHVRGSAIVNELRRSSHHALGKRTLQIANAYAKYIETGDDDDLVKLGFSTLSAADMEARNKREVLEITLEVVEDLERLLGSSDIMTQIQEWKDSYSESLLRCEFGKSVPDEIETLVSEGIHAKNRWVYQHHLRILGRKVDDFTGPAGLCDILRGPLKDLQGRMPDVVDFDADDAERSARELGRILVEAVQKAHEEELFGALRAVQILYEKGAFYEAFVEIGQLRAKVAELIRLGGFSEKRYRLYQLDCLLEEMGYLASRHVATAFQDGVDIKQCLGIIRGAIQNLEYDGLYSRLLQDIAELLNDPNKSSAELTDVITHVERTYHKIRGRAAAPLERMQKHFGLEPEELRMLLANYQRYMHDLNSMVHFSDIAKQHILHLDSRDSALSEPPQRVSGADGPHPILHLSHRLEIAEMVKRGAPLNLRDLYGAKGSGLLYISYLSIPTRDGFLLPTSISRANRHRIDPAWLESEITQHLRTLEDDITRRDGSPKRFGDQKNPLLLAVRGGSVFSMPGILASVLFVGMNDRVAEALAEEDPWGAYDSYRRFLASYASAVWATDLEAFNLVEEAKRTHGVQKKEELSWEAMKAIAESSKDVLRKQGHGEELDRLLENPMQQLFSAVQAVFGSWNTDTADRYREIKGLCHTWHTSATVQEMAFGNWANEPIQPGMDETRASLTGVIPRTRVSPHGIRELEGDFKFSAAGDDLVAGVTTSTSFRSLDQMQVLMPMLERRLRHHTSQLRRFLGTDQDVEFTVDRGVLSILQTRAAQSMFDEQTESFVDPGDAATRGLGVCGGAFRGLVAFDESDLQKLVHVDVDSRDDVDGVLIVLESPTPEDIPFILSAGGLLTAKGGSTSHAAIAVNSIENRSYSSVMSAAGLRVMSENHEAVLVDSDGSILHRIQAGDIVSLHGVSGEVYVGSRRVESVVLPTAAPAGPSR
jgi:enolase